MCKTKIQDLLDLAHFQALTKEQQALVVEACLGYYILNEPPDELVRVVRLVSDRFLAYIDVHPNVQAETISRYIAATDNKFYGVLEEKPSREHEGAIAQLRAALESDSIAIQLNAHRVMVRIALDWQFPDPQTGRTGRIRKGTGNSMVSDRYGAVGRMGGLELKPPTYKHEPASVQNRTEGPLQPYGMPALSGDSGSTQVLLKVCGAGAIGLMPFEQRWYCLGVLGFLLAPGAHSLHEMALTVELNRVADYMPCYRYLGFLGFEMQQAPWYGHMLATFGSSMRAGYWGEVERICYDLVRTFPLNEATWRIVFFFVGLPFVPPAQSSVTLQGKYKSLGS